MYDCLIVDDDETLAENTCEYLNLTDIKTAYVTNLSACEEFLSQHEVSLLLLDINLGNENGFSFCKRIRQSFENPIIFASARTSDDDVVLGLSLGGDDYILKPYSLNVLQAKVKATLRRDSSNRKSSRIPTDETIIEKAGIKVIPATQNIFKDGKELLFREKEYELLFYLITHPDRLITKGELFDNVWNNQFPGENTLNVHIRYIREKIERDPNNPQIIKTIWGRGYYFDTQSSDT